jgi:hypothetical protein
MRERERERERESLAAAGNRGGRLAAMTIAVLFSEQERRPH